MIKKHPMLKRILAVFVVLACVSRVVVADETAEKPTACTSVPDGDVASLHANHLGSTAMTTDERGRLLRGLTIAAATLTALSAGAAIGTGVAGQNEYDDLDENDPIERKQKDLDKARTLLYASRATMAVAITFGVATAILAPFAIKKGHKNRKATLELTPTLTQNGGGLFLKSSF